MYKYRKYSYQYHQLGHLSTARNIFFNMEVMNGIDHEISLLIDEHFLEPPLYREIYIYL